MAEEDGEVCEIIAWTKGKKLHEVIPQIMAAAEQTNREHGFTYDPVTEIVTSVTYVGSEQMCQIPFEKTLVEKGLFHTHPLEDKECMLSLTDMINGLRRGIHQEGAEEILGCPALDMTVKVQYPKEINNPTLLALLDAVQENEMIEVLDTAITVATTIQNKCELQPPDCLAEDFEQLPELTEDLVTLQQHLLENISRLMQELD